MKKKTFIPLFALLLFLVGCQKEPDVQAFVLDSSESQLFVATEMTKDMFDEVKELSTDDIIIKEMDDDDVYYGLIWLNTKKATSFEKGDQVNIWMDDAIMQSYPPQGNATKIQLMK